MSAPYPWSKPYYGITHCGPLRHDGWRVCVCDWSTFADLKCWYPGCGFRPIESRHDTVEEAKQAGEAWLRANDRHLPQATEPNTARCPNCNERISHK